MIPRTVGIVGLGLMGGSLARDLAAFGVRVLARDQSEDTIRQARDEGAVAGPLDLDAAGMADLDLLVIATPVDVAVEILRHVAPLLGDRTLVTDLGSTKSAICEAAERLGLGGRFIGSHPLAGDHRSGWEAARAGLFRDATVFLSPTGSAAGLPSLEAFWRELGARPVLVDPIEHDRTMAWVSHLPQVVSSALAAALAARGHTADQLGPGGRAMTRLAASSPEMWAAISAANAAELDRAVERVQQNLTSFRHFLADGDSAALLRFFRAARDWHS